MFIINKNSIFLPTFLLAIKLPSCYFHPILIVIAFDGFKPDYVNSTLTPNMYKLATNGVQGMMKPQFMSKTYPNLQSIATGLYEDVHGIVNNDFYDPIFKRRFKINDDFNDWWDNNVSLPVWVSKNLIKLSHKQNFNLTFRLQIKCKIQMNDSVEWTLGQEYKQVTGTSNQNINFIMIQFL